MSSIMETFDVSSLPPGFGFHPTDTELVSHFLKRKILGFKNDSKHEELIPVVDIYKHEPWDLPAKCHIPTRDSIWHFFALKDRKYPNGLRSNRSTEAGYWKSTGKDRNIKSKDRSRTIGTKKTLVFHEGRPPSGKRTDWIMHEYYLNENEYKAVSDTSGIYVICRVTKRNGFVSEDGEERKVGSKYGEMLTKTEVYFPVQPKVVDGRVVSKESSSVSDNNINASSISDINIDAWIAELLDPNFDIPCADELMPEMEADITSIAKEQEPLDSYFDLDAMGESAFLLEEDVQSILQSNNVNSEGIHLMPYGSHILESDVHGMLDITDVNIASWPPFPPELFEDDLSSYSSNVQEQTHQVSTTIDHAASAHSLEYADALQIPPSRQARPSQRFRLETSEMKSRNPESVNRTVEFVNKKCRLALNEVDRPVLSSKSSCDTLCATESEVPSKSTLEATGIPKSHGALANDASHRQGSKRGLSLSSLRSAGLNCLFVGACIVGTAAPILYLMLRDAQRSLANYASIGI